DDKIWPFGIEYQVRYNHLTEENHTGDYWASNTRFQWRKGPDGRFAVDGQLDEKRGGEHRATAAAPFHALDGEWNTCEVIVMDSTYSIHKLNGALVNYATELSVGEGIIGLQCETAEIFYRNIQIKELDEFIPASAFFPTL
ncbi:MAG: family 16 glycoside hydrolase, partial [Bacteroidota bacterium]